MPPIRDHDVSRAWKVVQVRPEKKVCQNSYYIDYKDRYECQSCGYQLVQNATRMQDHLLECRKYLDNAASKGIHNNITREASVIAKPQNRLPFPTISSTEKHAMDLSAARVCYLEGLPFSVFESASMREFLHMLNPAYKPPDRKTIAGTVDQELV